MQPIEFDRVIPRKNTDSLKWEGSRQKFGTEVFPMWVADMDFAVAEPIAQALAMRLQHPVFGYPDQDQQVQQAAQHWWQTTYGWKTDAEEILLVQGVVPALFAAVRAFSKVGDGIILLPPIYPPFFHAIADQDRRMLSVPLRQDNQGRYHLDFSLLAQSLPKARMLLFCSPHNPVGRVWEEAELQELGKLCQRHGVMVVSDEIHADLTWAPAVHTPMGKIIPESLVLAAVSKSFNVAGLGGAVAWLAGGVPRDRYLAELRRTGILGTNTMAKTAMVAAWREGGPWLGALCKYLAENGQVIQGFLRQELPLVQFLLPEFGYLAWLDLRALGWSDETLQKRLIAAGLGLNWGPSFGSEGSGFVRLNFGTPRTLLHRGLALLGKGLGNQADS